MLEESIPKYFSACSGLNGFGDDDGADDMYMENSWTGFPKQVPVLISVRRDSELQLGRACTFSLVVRNNIVSPSRQYAFV